MEHFVCQGECGGLSGEAGVCQTEGCSRHEEEMSVCDCTSPEHDLGKKEGEDL